MIKFFDIDHTRPLNTIITLKNGKKQVKQTGEIANTLPFISAFARSIGVCHDTLHEWANGKFEDGKLKHPTFSETYKTAKKIQKEMLVSNGLKGLYNSTAFIFTAKNITDMKDKQDIEHTGEVTRRIIIKQAQPNG